MQKKVECIVCKKPLTEVSVEENSFYPDDGLQFVTRGHYGSRVFDPVVGGFHLQLCICDTCIIQGIKDGHILGDTNEADLEAYTRKPIENENNIW